MAIASSSSRRDSTARSPSVARDPSRSVTERSAVERPAMLGNRATAAVVQPPMAFDPRRQGTGVRTTNRRVPTGGRDGRDRHWRWPCRRAPTRGDEAGGRPGRRRGCPRPPAREQPAADRVVRRLAPAGCSDEVAPAGDRVRPGVRRARTPSSCQEDAASGAEMRRGPRRQAAPTAGAPRRRSPRPSADGTVLRHQRAGRRRRRARHREDRRRAHPGLAGGQLHLVSVAEGRELGAVELPATWASPTCCSSATGRS